jgi:hypothetical protein
MASYFSLSNDSSSSGEASLSSLGCPLGSSEESYFTNSRKVALLDSPHPRKLPESLLFSIYEEQEGLKFKRMNEGSFREDYDGNRSPKAAEGQKSSIFGVCANLVNSMAGGGIVGIPYAFKLSGFLTGVYLLILTATLSGTLVCVSLQLEHADRFISRYIVSLQPFFVARLFSDKSMRIIVDMAAFHPRLQTENVKNYEELASYPFGPFGGKCVLYATFFLSVRTECMPSCRSSS